MKNKHQEANVNKKIKKRAAKKWKKIYEELKKKSRIKKNSEKN